MIQRGAINIMLDGQFGSTGKGLWAGYVAQWMRENMDCSDTMFMTNASPNAGHTFINSRGKKTLLYHLSMAGTLLGGPQYLSAGSIVDLDILLQEMEENNIENVYIHPRAAIVRTWDKLNELKEGSSATKLASTQKGVGSALARKISREEGAVAEQYHLPPNVILANFDPMLMVGRGETIWMEVPQGMDLSLNHGLAYPFCTSREVSVSQALSDIGAHPSALGHVHMTLRTYPIRVGHVYDQDGRVIGDSGPYHSDQIELSWRDLGVPVEKTTVTGRPRRIFSWSDIQVGRAIRRAQPSYVFLNFCNYCKTEEEQQILIDKINKMAYKPYIYTGHGPKVTDIKRVQ